MALGPAYPAGHEPGDHPNCSCSGSSRPSAPSTSSSYEGIASRAGVPTTRDVVFGFMLVILLLEATRRVIGPALPVIASLFIVYVFTGPHLPRFSGLQGRVAFPLHLPDDDGHRRHLRRAAARFAAASSSSCSSGPCSNRARRRQLLHPAGDQTASVVSGAAQPRPRCSAARLRA
ncbi:MAG: hypothetical protein V8Q84_07095 [Bilophila sp.]